MKQEIPLCCPTPTNTLFKDKNFCHTMKECRTPLWYLRNVMSLGSHTDFPLGTRCDSSIMKLSGDIHIIKQEHRQAEKAIQELASAIEMVSKSLDIKVTENRWTLTCYCQKQDQHTYSKSSQVVIFLKKKNTSLLQAFNKTEHSGTPLEHSARYLNNTPISQASCLL